MAKKRQIKSHFSEYPRKTYEDVFREQNYGCKICGKVNLNGKKLSQDHNHVTKNLRGLLCFGCNMGLGCFKDSPELLIAAAKYLREHA